MQQFPALQCSWLRAKMSYIRLAKSVEHEWLADERWRRFVSTLCNVL